MSEQKDTKKFSDPAVTALGWRWASNLDIGSPETRELLKQYQENNTPYLLERKVYDTHGNPILDNQMRALYLR